MAMLVITRGYPIPTAMEKSISPFAPPPNPSACAKSRSRASCQTPGPMEVADIDRGWMVDSQPKDRSFCEQNMIPRVPRVAVEPFLVAFMSSWNELKKMKQESIKMHGMSGCTD